MFLSQFWEMSDLNQQSSTLLRVFCFGDLNCWSLPKSADPPLHLQVGVLKVRLFRPWDRNRFMAALPTTTKRICVLDRTKEPQGASWSTWRLEWSMIILVCIIRCRYRHWSRYRYINIDPDLDTYFHIFPKSQKICTLETGSGAGLARWAALLGGEHHPEGHVQAEHRLHRWALRPGIQGVHSQHGAVGLRKLEEGPDFLPSAAGELVGACWGFFFGGWLVVENQGWNAGFWWILHLGRWSDLNVPNSFQLFIHPQPTNHILDGLRRSFPCGPFPGYPKASLHCGHHRWCNAPVLAGGWLAECAAQGNHRVHVLWLGKWWHGWGQQECSEDDCDGHRVVCAGGISKCSQVTIIQTSWSIDTTKLHRGLRPIVNLQIEYLWLKQNLIQLFLQKVATETYRGHLVSWTCYEGLLRVRCQEELWRHH